MADLMPQMHPTPAPPLQQQLQQPIQQQQQQQSVPTMPSVPNLMPMLDQSNGPASNQQLQQQQPQQMEKAANDLAPTPRLQSNMYKLQRNRSEYLIFKYNFFVSIKNYKIIF